MKNFLLAWCLVVVGSCTAITLPLLLSMEESAEAEQDILPGLKPGDRIRVTTRTGHTLMSSMDGLLYIKQVHDGWVELEHRTADDVVTSRWFVRREAIDYYWLAPPPVRAVNKPPAPPFPEKK